MPHEISCHDGCPLVLRIRSCSSESFPSRVLLAHHVPFPPSSKHSLPVCPTCPVPGPHTDGQTNSQRSVLCTHFQYAAAFCNGGALQHGCKAISKTCSTVWVKGLQRCLVPGAALACCAVHCTGAVWVWQALPDGCCHRRRLAADVCFPSGVLPGRLGAPSGVLPGVRRSCLAAALQLLLPWEPPSGVLPGVQGPHILGHIVQRQLVQREVGRQLHRRQARLCSTMRGCKGAG